MRAYVLVIFWCATKIVLSDEAFYIQNAAGCGLTKPIGGARICRQDFDVCVRNRVKISCTLIKFHGELFCRTRPIAKACPIREDTLPSAEEIEGRKTRLKCRNTRFAISV